MLSTHRMVAPGSPYSHLPGLMGPMVAAFVVAALPGGALRDRAASLIRWPIRPDLVLALTLAAPLIAFGCIAFAHVFGGAAWPDTAALSAYPGLPKGLSTLAGIAVVLVLNGFGEEAGWRGWLLPALMARFGTFCATLVLSAIWLVWHAPLFWLNATMAALVVRWGSAGPSRWSAALSR